MWGEAVQVLLALGSVAVNLLDPLIQLANGIDLYMEAAKTSPIEVTKLILALKYLSGYVPSDSERGFLALQRQATPSPVLLVLHPWPRS